MIHFPINDNITFKSLRSKLQNYLGFHLFFATKSSKSQNLIDSIFWNIHIYPLSYCCCWILGPYTSNSFQLPLSASPSFTFYAYPTLSQIISQFLNIALIFHYPSSIHATVSYNFFFLPFFALSFKILLVTFYKNTKMKLCFIRRTIISHS